MEQGDTIVALNRGRFIPNDGGYGMLGVFAELKPGPAHGVLHDTVGGLKVGYAETECSLVPLAGRGQVPDGDAYGHAGHIHAVPSWATMATRQWPAGSGVASSVKWYWNRPAGDFGSKLGLYSFVRTDVERRLLDRMERAAAGPHGTCQAALVVGFDYAVQQDYVFLLSETPPLGEPDRLASVLDRLSGPAPPPSGRILASAWRAALAAVADGTPSDQARSALELLLSPHHET